jgi:hypothetical protein
LKKHKIVNDVQKPGLDGGRAVRHKNRAFVETVDNVAVNPSLRHDPKVIERRLESLEKKKRLQKRK